MFYIKIIKLFVSKIRKSEPLFIGSVAMQICVVFGDAWGNVKFYLWHD